jgi:rhodanese-related sulfurtransferase
MRGKAVRREIAVLAGVSLILAATLLPRLAVGQVENIDSQRAAELINENQGNADFVIIDVRSPGEYAGGRIGNAINIPIQAPDFRARLQDLDREKSYLVYCEVGGRSSKAVGVMKELGFKTVYHLFKGISQWRAEGLPEEK